jgi:hypothetical protein
MYVAGTDGALRSKNEINEQEKTNRKEKKKESENCKYEHST